MTAHIALVTGASSGIGAEFARQLAGRGYHLVVVARRQDRLTRLAASLGAAHGVQVEVLAADLAEAEGLARVQERARNGDIDLLVNNAGFGIGRNFARADLARQEEMFRVHMLAPMRLMHEALPGMIERRRGGVINVASLAAFVSLPGNANYSATKAYLMRFSRALHGEVRRYGVTVQALCPGFVRTEMKDRAKQEEVQGRQLPAFLWMQASTVVADSLRAFERRKSLVVPGFGYKLLYWMAKLGIADALAPNTEGR